MGKEKKKSKDDLATKENIVKSWVTFLIVTLFFVIIFRGAWWILFPIIGVFIHAIEQTASYYTDNVKCPNCEKIVDEGANFCRQCGTQVVTNCPKCEASISGTGQFCDECGEKLYAEPRQQIQAPDQGTQREIGGLHFCPACGIQMAEGTQICPDCGFTQ